MLIRDLLVIVLSCFWQANTLVGQSNEIKIQWSELPVIPDKVGFNGSFIGVQNEVLIVAGGANYPDQPFWEGGVKQWYDNIYVLRKDEQGDLNWYTQQNWKLPRPLSNGVTIDSKEGTVCIGGSNAHGAYSNVFLLKWNIERGEFLIEELPSLPNPLTFMGGDRIEDVIYVAGGVEDNQQGATNHFFSLDLSQRNQESFQWVKLTSWPGEPRINPVVLAQSNGRVQCLYVIGGRNFRPQDEYPHRMLSDVLVYNPQTREWTRNQDIPGNETPGVEGGCVGAAPSVGLGESNILILGGAGGPNQLLMKRMEISIQIRELQKSLDTLSDPGEITLCKEKISALQDQIKELIMSSSFSKEILSYNTITDTWTSLGELPGISQAVTRAVYFKGDIVIPGGEVGPGVRTNRVKLGKVVR